MTTRNYEEPTIPGIIADKTKGTLYTKGKFFGKVSYKRKYNAYLFFYKYVLKWEVS